MSSIVLGAVKAVKEAITWFSTSGAYTVLQRALKWPFSPSQTASSKDKWSANQRRFHLDG